MIGNVLSLFSKRIIGERQFQTDDWARFDYVIVMDNDNRQTIKSGYDANKDVVLAMLTDYTVDPAEVNVPDPYYTGDFDTRKKRFPGIIDSYSRSS